LAGLDIGDVLAGMGRSLRALHDRPAPTTAPDRSNPALAAEAEQRLTSGLVDADRFDPPYRRHRPEALLVLVQRSVPFPPEVPVLIHGDARLSTLRVEGEAISWSASAVGGSGDAYRDLATVAVDLADAISPEALGPFLDAYGIDHPDLVRLDWHVLIDQLLR
jgi:aminoglycoside phosphotransferase